jgi:hypothetical protein
MLLGRTHGHGAYNANTVCICGDTTMYHMRPVAIDKIIAYELNEKFMYMEWPNSTNNEKINSAVTSAYDAILKMLSFNYYLRDCQKSLRNLNI